MAKRTLLTKEQILGAKDSKTEYVEVPEWGGTVKVKSLSGTERDAFESSLVTGKGRQQKISTENIRAKLVALCIIDEEGNRLFTDAEVGVLGLKSAAALDRAYEAAARLSKISKADEDELVGNSASDRSDTSL